MADQQVVSSLITEVEYLADPALTVSSLVAEAECLADPALTVSSLIVEVEYTSKNSSPVAPFIFIF